MISFAGTVALVARISQLSPAPRGNVRYVEGGKETELFLPDEYYQKLDDNIAKAIASRGAEIVRI